MKSVHIASLKTTQHSDYKLKTLFKICTFLQVVQMVLDLKYFLFGAS